MSLRNAALLIVLVLLTTLALVGCEEDSTGPGASAADFRGIWNVEGEVVAKRTCSREIGDLIQWDVTIAQDGNRGVISFGGPPHELTISGSTATASWAEESDFDVSLTISEGVLGGNVTATNSQGETPCTEVFSLSGTRSGDPPAPGFAGNWDLVTQVTNSFCDGVAFGETEQVCRTIEVDGVAIRIDDPDGPIIGVIDNTSAILWRLAAEEVLTVRLTAAQGGLSGTVMEDDLVNLCRVNSSISGTSRDGACPPPPTPSDFAGSWYPDIYRTSTFGCGLVNAEGQYFGQCMSVTVNGSSVTVDDGSGRGALNGSIEENAVLVSRDEGDGIYELRLEIGEGGLVGSSSKIYTSGQCSGGDLEFEFDGVRLPLPCASSGGPFAGAWNLDIQLTANSCEFPPPGPDCSEIFQNGNLVFIDGAFLSGDQATVTGNTLSLQEETVFEDSRFIVDTMLEVDGSGNTFSGTQTLTIQSISSPQSGCTTSANVTGTRTTSCGEDVEEERGSKGFGLLRAPIRAR